MQRDEYVNILRQVDMTTGGIKKEAKLPYPTISFLGQLLRKLEQATYPSEGERFIAVEGCRRVLRNAQESLTGAQKPRTGKRTREGGLPAKRQKTIN